MTTVKPSTRPSITPFFRLDQAIGWRQSLNSEGILNDVVNAQLRLGKPGDFPISPTEPFGSFGGMTLPRGVTVSKEGQVLLVDPSNNRILYHDNLPCEKASIDQRTPYPFRELWAPSVLTHADNSGLHELIGGDVETRDVETRDVEANGVYDLLKPEDVVFSPDGNIVVADTGHRRVIIYLSLIHI